MPCSKRITWIIRAYTNGPEWTKQYLDDVHAQGSNFNSGQMWYKASERNSRWIQTSLAHGVMCTPNCGLEQNVLHDAAKRASVGDTELNIKPYTLNIQPLPITYATFAVERRPATRLGSHQTHGRMEVVPHVLRGI